MEVTEKNTRVYDELHLAEEVRCIKSATLNCALSFLFLFTDCATQKKTRLLDGFSVREDLNP